MGSTFYQMLGMVVMAQVFDESSGNPSRRTAGSELRPAQHAQWQLPNPLMTHGLNFDFVILVLIIGKIS